MHRLAGFLTPVTIYRVTGVLPFAPFAGIFTSAQPYRPREVTAKHEYRAPESADGSPVWNIFPVRVSDVSELITIDGGIAMRCGHVLDSNGLVIPRAIHKKRYYAEPGWRSDHWPAGRRIPRVSGIVASVTASTQWNYYHWLFDVLPRLSILTDLEIDFDRLYIQRARPFQKQTLSLIGVDDNLVLDCDETPIIRAERLLVPCHQTTGRRRYPTWVSEKLREWFLPSNGKMLNPRRLYVGRSAQYGRELSNEDEILRFLEPLGFEFVLPERLQFAEQVELFQQAEAIVAPHGAGLANIVFCRPGTVVIELFPPDMKYTYYKISQTVGLRYYYARAAGEQGRVMSRGNFRISIKSLSGILAMSGIVEEKGVCPRELSPPPGQAVANPRCSGHSEVSVADQDGHASTDPASTKPQSIPEMPK